MARGALYCIVCRGLLAEDAGGLRCTGCQKRYPVIEGTPVIVGDPATHLARTFISLREIATDIDGKLDRLARAVLLESPAAAEHERVAAALASNRELVQWMCDAVAPHISPAHLYREAAARGQVFGDPVFQSPFTLLGRDWDPTPDNERSIARVKEVIAGAVSKLPPGGGDTLVLGAGAGRIACEAPGDRVVAIDANAVVALPFQRILRGDFRGYDVLHSTTGARPDRAFPLDPSAGFAGVIERARERVEYVVCDGRELPLADQSVSLVVSVFFDIVPLRPVLHEVSRVLKPGGVYVHFGPVEFAPSYPADEIPTVDEVRALFRELGFRIDDEAWGEGPYRHRPDAFRWISFRHWSFSAVRVVEPTLPGPNDVLSLRGILEIDKRTVVSDTAQELVSATIRGHTGAFTTTDAALLELVESLDGVTPLGELLDGIEEEDVDRAKVVTALADMCMLGLLQHR